MVQAVGSGLDRGNWSLECPYDAIRGDFSVFLGWLGSDCVVGFVLASLRRNRCYDSGEDSVHDVEMA